MSDFYDTGGGIFGGPGFLNRGKGLQFFQPQNNYGKYAFYVDFADGKGTDRVSHTPMETVLSAGRVKPDGTVLGVNEPCIQDGKLNTLGQIELLNGMTDDVSNAYYTKVFSSAILNTATAPDGSLAADRYKEDLTNDRHDFYLPLLSNFPIAPITVSVYAKAMGRRWIKIRHDGAGMFKGAYFDLVDGVVGIVDSGYTAEIKSCGNDWHRCSVTTTSTATSWYPGIMLISDALSIQYQGDGVSGVALWCFNITKSSYLLPPVHNDTTGPLTIPHGYSDADEGYKWPLASCPKAVTALQGTAGNNAQGTLEVEWTPQVNATSTLADTTTSIFTGSSTPFICCFARTTAANVHRICASDDATSVHLLTADFSWLAGVTYKLAVRYGPHPGYDNAGKYQLTVTDGTTTWGSAITNFDGSFNPLTHFSIGWLSTYWQQLSKISVKEGNPWIA